MRNPFIRCAAAGILAAGLYCSCASGEEARPPTVLFDEGHGQHFLVAGKGPLDLSGLAAEFAGQGLRVATSTQEIDDTMLSSADVLVVSGAFAPFTQRDAVQSFAVAIAGQSGNGRFVVFGDDAIFQNQFFKGNNQVLGRNLARWLGQPG